MYVGLSVNCPLSLSPVTKLELSRQIFEKFSNIKFHEETSSGNQIVQCGRTNGQAGRHDEANSRSSQFYERAKESWHILTVSGFRKNYA
jgi:hypothetical protein